MQSQQPVPATNTNSPPPTDQKQPSQLDGVDASHKMEYKLTGIPNEVIANIVARLPQKDQHSFALLSRHLNAVATPVLYSSIVQTGPNVLPGLLRVFLDKPVSIIPLGHT